MEDPIPISTTLAADTLMPGLKTLSPSQARVLEKQRAYTSTAIPTSPASLGTIAWTIPFEPNWRNLVKWMELFHAGQLLGPPKDDEGASQERAAFAVFDVVEALRGEEWGMVVKVLPGLRAMLGAGEGWWLADEQGAGGVEDGGVGKEETA